MPTKSTQPVFDLQASDQNLVAGFLSEIRQRYPSLNNALDEHNGLLHIQISRLQTHAEGLSKKHEDEKLNQLFVFIEPYFRKSKNELLNAFNVSFLEYFDFGNRTEREIKFLMPESLFIGWHNQKVYMENLAKNSKK